MGAISILPLGLDLWSDLEILFGPKGACGGCWCMNYRCFKKEFETGKGVINQKRLKEKVESGKHTGLLAYETGNPIGWISIAPRSEFPRMQKSRVMQTDFEGDIWCITCVLVGAEFRGRGLSDHLVKAAVEYAFQNGADCVEAFPSVIGVQRLPPPFIWKGLPGMYLRNGFEIIRKPSNSQWVMRKERK
jgi:GNAT superfamily N-acetyltransferase